MAKSVFSGGSSAVYSRRRVVSHVRTYNWPPLQLNFWIFVMLVAASSIVGVFGSFVQIQDQLQLPVPWYVSPIFRFLTRVRMDRTAHINECLLLRYFPYYITVGSIAIVTVLGLFWLIFQRRLLPMIVMIGDSCCLCCGSWGWSWLRSSCSDRTARCRATVTCKSSIKIQRGPR